MTDLDNNFPSWGETGEFPAAGFFYEGGDQVNEKHLDALWNGIHDQFNEFIDGIEERVSDAHGDFVLDNGLQTTLGGGAREVDVSASSSGAYVDGQQTGSTSSTTVTLSTNGGGSTRTDSIWVDEDGQIGKSEGTTTVSDGKHKLAEADVETNDTISDLRETRRALPDFAASDEPITAEGGAIWYDTVENAMKAYLGGQFRTMFPADGSEPMTGDLDLNGNQLIDTDGTINVGNVLRLSDDLVASDGETIWDESNGFVPVDRLQIKDGESQAIDASEFSGSDGSAGQALITDGSSTSWSAISHPVFGPGEDGSITDSTSQTRGGFLAPTDYTLEAGNTISVDSTSKLLLIIATQKITIDGTIDASAISNNGGAGNTTGGNSNETQGSNGGPGHFTPLQAGGIGGAGNGINGGRGGDGGDGDTRNTIKHLDILKTSVSAITVMDNNTAVAAGGGGGAGSDDFNGGSGNDGNFPGGAGGGGGEGNGIGGQGGAGGGGVLLIAPTIEIGGTINVSGGDGEDGTGDCGGGGGGSGGLIYIQTNNLSENSPTYDVSGGVGGLSNGRGGDGANGADGEVIKNT
jgi:hypothetical protein